MSTYQTSSSGLNESNQQHLGAAFGVAIASFGVATASIRQAIRTMGNLDSSAYNSAADLVSALGISIKTARFLDNDGYTDCLGFCEFDENEKPVIVLRDDINDSEQNFALFHEIGHVLMHRDQLLLAHKGGCVSMARRGVDSDVHEIDKEASEFARQILVDKDKLNEFVFDGLSVEDIATRFCIPVDHLLVAAKAHSVVLQN